jgi:hypothetical protein
MYGRINELGLFTFRPQATRHRHRRNEQRRFDSCPNHAMGRCSPEKQVWPARCTRSFSIPHTPLEDTVLAADVIGVRLFGSESTLETVAIKVNEKLQDMKDKIDQTMEWRKMSALKGVCARCR